MRVGFELKASDIHLTVGVPPVMRINGDLKRYGKNNLAPNDTEIMAQTMIPEKLWEVFEDRGELDFSYSLKEYLDLGSTFISKGHVFHWRYELCLRLSLV